MDLYLLFFIYCTFFWHKPYFVPIVQNLEKSLAISLAEMARILSVDISFSYTGFTKKTRGIWTIKDRSNEKKNIEAVQKIILSKVGQS